MSKDQSDQFQHKNRVLRNLICKFKVVKTSYNNEVQSTVYLNATIIVKLFLNLTCALIAQHIGFHLQHLCEFSKCLSIL